MYNCVLHPYSSAGIFYNHIKHSPLSTHQTMRLVCFTKYIVQYILYVWNQNRKGDETRNKLQRVFSLFYGMTIKKYLFIDQRQQGFGLLLFLFKNIKFDVKFTLTSELHSDAYLCIINITASNSGLWKCRNTFYKQTIHGPTQCLYTITI